MDNVDERRLPQGGSPQESWYQDWPAANDPQTPPVPGAKRPRRTSVTTERRAHEASAPEPAPCSGRPPPFLRQWPHTGPTCQQSQRDSLPGREEERTPKGCERARNRDSPIWGAPDPRLHIYSPTLVGHPIGAQAFDGPESGAGGPTLYGVVRAWVDFAIRSGPLRFAPYPGRKGPWAREGRGFVLVTAWGPDAPQAPWSPR